MSTKKLINQIWEYLWSEFDKTSSPSFELFCKGRGVDILRLLQMESGEIKVDKKYVDSCRYRMIQ